MPERDGDLASALRNFSQRILGTLMKRRNARRIVSREYSTPIEHVSRDSDDRHDYARCRERDAEQVEGQSAYA